MTVSSSFAGAYHYTFKRKRSIEATGISLPSRTPPGRPGHPLEALSDFQAPPVPRQHVRLRPDASHARPADGHLQKR